MKNNKRKRKKERKREGNMPQYKCNIDTQRIHASYIISVIPIIFIGAAHVQKKTGSLFVS
jgi:hypothetical protein